MKLQKRGNCGACGNITQTSRTSASFSVASAARSMPSISPDISATLESVLLKRRRSDTSAKASLPTTTRKLFSGAEPSLFFAKGSGVSRTEEMSECSGTTTQ